MAEDGPTKYREALLRETREELARADTKASILLAASGIAFAALLEDPDDLVQRRARLLAWAGLSLTLAGICFVAAAVKPRLRTKHSRTPKPHYFGDVEAYRPIGWRRVWRRREALREGHDRFAEALAETEQEGEYTERLTDQIWHLSRIAYRKYRLVMVGMWLYAAALVAGIAALVTEKQWL